jgi:hypothetical protein
MIVALLKYKNQTKVIHFVKMPKIFIFLAVPKLFEKGVAPNRPELSQ